MVGVGQAEVCGSEGTRKQVPRKDGAAALVGNALVDPKDGVFRGMEHCSPTDYDPGFHVGKVSVALMC